MALVQFAVELFAQDRTPALGDFATPLADGVYKESEIYPDGVTPFGDACNKLCIATIEESELDGMTDAQKFAYVINVAESA